MNDLITLLKQLISCPSITPQDAQCQKIITGILKESHFNCESLPFENVENLWARYGTARPLIVFAGHTDVVPPGSNANWRSPPFQPMVQDEYLYGRGATDMKGALSAMIVAAKTFIKNTPNFSGSIAFLLTSDEEGHSLHGTKKVIQTLKKRGIKIDYCIVGEPSSINHVGDQIRIGRRGSLHAQLTVHGVQGHVALPHLADNPIHPALFALHQIVQTEWDQGSSEFPPTSLQISNIHAGAGVQNIIPDRLEALFNFRFSPASSITSLQERTKNILQKNGVKFSLDWEIGAEPFLSAKGKLMIATQKAIKKVTGLEAKQSTGGGTSDGRFIHEIGAEIVELGVPHQTAHQVNECVRLDDLSKLSEIYHEILDQLVGHSSEVN